MSTIKIPDFDFSAFYYAQIFEALVAYKRINAPELTDESDYELTMQLLKAFALVGHLNNVTLDTIANESTLPTARLVETVRNMLRLIDYELKPASPAQTDLLYKLSRVFTTSYEIIRQYSQAATKSQGDEPSIFFEVLEALTVDPTNGFTDVLAYDNSAYTDVTTKANEQLPGNSFVPWAARAQNDMLYFGHKTAMWDTIELAFITPDGGNMAGVWEYREFEWRRVAPTSVEYDGQLTFDLTSLLGAVDRSGMTARVQLNSTGAKAEGTVVWDGSANKITVDLLNAVVSTTPTDYTIGADWLPIDVIADGTTGLTVDGEIEFSLPQTTTRNWIKETINGVEAYWLRYRIISASDPSPIEIDYARMDTGGQYVLRLATQGRAYTEDPLGSSDGTPDQQFELSKENFIWDSEIVTVDGEIWQRVDNFLSSDSGSKVYTLALGENDVATITFGNGATGKVPPLGSGNISCTYRYGASNDGNVGANTVTIDKTGISFVERIWNPRQATGWQEAQGANEASLEKAKIEGPASIRVKDVALSPSDVEYMTTQYEVDGSRPFVRARAFEEGLGAKTVEVVVVPAGGTPATQEQLDDLTTYFNGDRYAVPPLPKRVVSNQEVGAINYTPHYIDVEATVYGDVTEQAIKATLSALLHPESLKDDGVTWQWEFGGNVPSSRISHEIFETDPSITKVVQTQPPIDIDTQLAPRELPMIGTITLTIVEP